MHRSLSSRMYTTGLPGQFVCHVFTLGPILRTQQRSYIFPPTVLPPIIMFACSAVVLETKKLRQHEYILTHTHTDNTGNVGPTSHDGYDDLCLTNEESYSSYKFCIKVAHFRNCAKQCTSIKENNCTHMAELPKQYINAHKNLRWPKAQAHRRAET